MKAKLDSSFQKIRLIELYIRNVGANLSFFNAFNVFLGDRAPEDDVTLVVIKITKTSVLNFVFGV